MDIRKLNLRQLKAIAKKQEIENYNKLKKDKIICIEFLRGVEIETIPNITEYRCSHGKHKYYCKECGGKGICEHGRNKFHCKECRAVG